MTAAGGDLPQAVEADGGYTPHAPTVTRGQWLVAAGTLAAGALVLAHALALPSDAGYGGVGPAFVPVVVGVLLLACGSVLAAQAWAGGFRGLELPAGAAHGDWRAFAWLSAGIVANAVLITHIGFVAGCTLCYVLAVRGLRLAQGQADKRLSRWLADAGTGAAISLPVYLMFTKLLAINLPGLTGTGWL
jgi:putative tricarboxylic transport membrane protein